MKKFISIFLFISSSLFAQNKFNLLKTINVSANFFTTDNQSNIYVVKENELIKFDKTGKELYKYSNKNLGNIDFVDASNMLKILVFYKNFSQGMFLDNTLSLTGEPISFDKLGYQQVQLICASQNNSVWIYNQQNFALLQLDISYNVSHQTENLNALLNLDLQPNFLLEHDNKIYLNNPSTGILIFDIYGTYYKTIAVKNAEKIEVIGDWVYFIENKKARAYNIKTTEEKQFEMPVSDFLNYRLGMGLLLIQTTNNISIYTAE